MKDIIEANYKKITPYIKKRYICKIEENKRSFKIKETLIQALQNTVVANAKNYPNVLKEDYILFLKSKSDHTVHKNYNNYFDFVFTKYDIPLSFEYDMLTKNLLIKKKWRIYMIWDCNQSLFCIGSRFPILDTDLPEYINEIIRILLKYPECINYNNGACINTNHHCSTYAGKDIYNKYLELLNTYGVQI